MCMMLLLRAKLRGVTESYWKKSHHCPKDCWLCILDVHKKVVLITASYHALPNTGKLLSVPNVLVCNKRSFEVFVLLTEYSEGMLAQWSLRAKRLRFLSLSSINCWRLLFVCIDKWPKPILSDYFYHYDIQNPHIGGHLRCDEVMAWCKLYCHINPSLQNERAHSVHIRNIKEGGEWMYTTY